MMAHRERIEAEYGHDELWKAIGPGHEEAWQYGYINGKLATLRWVLGSERDFLDTRTSQTAGFVSAPVRRL